MSQPADILNNPRPSQWVRVNADGAMEIRAGKVELGQGVRVMLMQIAADELDVPLQAIRLVAGHTALCPDQGLTAGSLSTEIGGMALRQVCAEVRRRFIAAAARRLVVDRDLVNVDNGIFRANGASATCSYAELAADVDLDVDMVTGEALAVPKAPPHRRIAGSSAARPDLLKKLFGAAYIHDLELSGMLHARLVRPPSYGASLLAPDEAACARIRALPGVQTLFIDGRYVGVCAEREEQAIAAAAALRRALRWEENTSLPAPAEDQSWLRALPALHSVVEHARAENDVNAGTLEDPADEGADRISVNYSRPFLAHASIGPACGLAAWEDGRLTVWTHGQGSFTLRVELARLFALDPELVTVIHADGAGCYGHNGADDAAADAAVLALAAGRPVRVSWSREDEFAWAPFGSAMSVQIDAALDAHGRIAHWHHQTWSQSHVQRPGVLPGLYTLAARHRAAAEPQQPVRDFPLPAGGGQRNSVPIYDLPVRGIDYHLLEKPTLRSSALRTLGAYANVFAIESCMDELALLAATDPLAFRLAHLSEPRAIAVLETVARMAAWHDGKAPASSEDALRGRGLGFARYKNTGAYCAVVVEIEVTERIVLDRIWTVVDAGEVINPDGVINQMEGGILQAASWTLKEAVQWDATRVTTRSWDDYPILGFDEVPRSLEVHLMARPELPPLGVGECAAGPAAAAIANALADAVGMRVRNLPLTPERLASAAAG
jgi:nicotinate dehydrogenase subunit B